MGVLVGWITVGSRARNPASSSGQSRLRENAAHMRLQVEPRRLQAMHRRFRAVHRCASESPLPLTQQQCDAARPQHAADAVEDRVVFSGDAALHALCVGDGMQ